jgi:DNA-binding transcriptional MerR regulator
MAGEFNDRKDEGALRTIGELEAALGIKAHVLRYWEGQFPQLQPLKRSGGRRYYRVQDVALVREIHRLVNGEGYTLRGAKAALKDFRPGAPLARPDLEAGVEAALAAAAAPAVPAEAIARLRAIRAQLAAALEI